MYVPVQERILKIEKRVCQVKKTVLRSAGCNKAREFVIE